MRSTTRRGFLVSIAAVATVAGCGRVRDSRLNPFNWFGRSRGEKIEQAPTDFTNDPRRYVENVIALNVDPTPEGAIIRAVGVTQIQGYWDAELVEQKQDDPSRLVYEFRVAPPLKPKRQGSQASREIIVGKAVSNFRLQSVRSIVVIGRANQRSVRR